MDMPNTQDNELLQTDADTVTSADETQPPQKISPLKKMNNRIATRSPKLARVLSEYGYLLLAALVPAVIMYLIYLVRGLYPFGDECVLVLDLNGQYVSFYDALRDIIRGDADILYSFSRNLGGEFLGIFDYYVASPLAVILVLFPKHRLLEGLLVLFLLKVAISGFTMGFYLHKHSHNLNRLAVIAFSVMYALCSYAVVQQNNSMWIDALMWLPLLTYGIEELIRHGRFRLFVFTLAITVFSNFYIGYMVCIYVAAYCVYYYLAHNQNNEINPTGESRHFVKSVGRVAIWALLALGIAAIAILSAKYSLGMGKDEFSTPKWEITQKFDFVDFLYKFLPSSYDTVRPAGLPVVYCGMLTLLTVPAFFLSKKFSAREKVAAGFFILFFVLSFATSSIDLIWHGFQKPNWLNYRYSFMLCFFLITLGYRAFDRIEFTSRKTLTAIAAFIGLFIIVAQKLTPYLFVKGQEANDDFKFRPFATIWLALACLAVYFVLICLQGKVSLRKKETVSAILAFVVCVEIFLNGLCDINALDEDVTYSNYSKYNNAMNSLVPIVETVKEYDDGFYRMEKTYHRKTNDNFNLGIKGLSLSTSTLNRKTIDFLQDMGYASKSHWSKYLGGTPVNDSLLGIKYLISDSDLSHYYGEPIFTPEDYGYDEDTPRLDKEFDVYYNEHALSLAFAVSDAWADINLAKCDGPYKCKIPDCPHYDNPFDRLNAMITAMLGAEETVQVFVPATRNGDPKTENLKVGTAELHTSYKVESASQTATVTYSYTVPTDKELYLYFPTWYTRKVKLAVNGSSKGTFGDNETTRIVSLGKLTTTDMSLKVTIDNDSKNFYVIPHDSYVYYIDWDVFTAAMKTLGEHQLIIDSHSTDSHLSGSITTDNASQLVYTSIPYDAGWKIYVDGERVDTLPISDETLIAFRIEGAGEHTVEMRYMPSIIALGSAISAICALLFVLILIFYRYLKRIPVIKNWFIIDLPDLPAVDTPESLAAIEAGDIGAPTSSDEVAVSEPTSSGSKKNAAKYKKNAQRRKK